MKTKKIILTACCMLLSAFLLGATNTIKMTNEAANGSASEAPESDRLIGVLITDEYLDLFDTDRFLSDNIHRLTDGKEISEAESAKYQGRLYASLVETAYTDDETGETITSKEYVFDGMEGIRFFTPYIREESRSYWSTTLDEEITDGYQHLQSTDDGENITLKGTIFLSAHSSFHHFYINPVYQTSDGEVYAVSGDGIFWDDERTPGASWSKTITENQEVNAGDRNTSSGAEVEITFCVMREPTKIALLQFNNSNELLERTEYRPGTLPKHLDVLSDTQYILVETSTSEGPNRTLIQKEDDYASAFYCRSDGICLKQECEIGWDHSAA